VEAMNDKKRKIKRIIVKALRIILISLLTIFIISLFILPPVIMNDMINLHVNFKHTYEASSFDLTANEIKLTTADGIRIAAYEVQEENPKAVIIIISGIHNPSVTSFFGQAKWLKENGYASVLYELRAHGESEGDTICLGYKEVLDTKAVVDYINAQDRYSNVPIVVYGVSMGGATAINSIGEIPEIDGLISASAYSSWEDAFYDNMVNMGAPAAYAWLQRPFVKLYTNFKYGFDTSDITPEKEIQKLNGRPALLMHSRGDTQVPYQSFTRIMKNAPNTVETWIRDGDLHFIVKDETSFQEPEKDPEYADKLLHFLERNFD
jgi:uncharacterized protein